MSDKVPAYASSLLGGDARLFRSEVLASRQEESLGAIRFRQPASSTLTAVLSILIAVALTFYVIAGSVTKKVHVAGLTVPIGGSLSIVTTRSGILMRTLVVEGQKVDAGQPLFELASEVQGRAGEMNSLLQQQIAVRKQALAAERSARLEQANEKIRSLNQRLRNLEMEREQVEEEISISARRKALAQQSLEKYQALQQNGFVSAAQSQQKQEGLLDVQARISALSRTKVQILAAALQLQSEKNDVTKNLAMEIAQLERTQASLAAEGVENEYRKENIIVAPEAGLITTITNDAGQWLAAGQVVATLIPSANGRGKQLEVNLYAPSRLVGFVAKGQRVRIRYEAFPYQKFGSQDGQVVDVSRTPLAPNELPNNIAPTIFSAARRAGAVNGNSESLYRIRVKLAKQTIVAYGTEQTLKPSMTAEADIVQDKRKIWEWIAEPLLAMTQR